jgi:putative redox protein
MKVTLERIDDAYHFRTTNDTGNTVESDASPKIGGGHKAMRPMQMLLASLGSCSGIDIVEFLRKMRQPLEGMKIFITAEREQDKTPSLFTSIHMHYVLTGDLNPKKVERAISMSVETYCSVAKMLEKHAPISWDYEIVSEV